MGRGPTNLISPSSIREASVRRKERSGWEIASLEEADFPVRRENAAMASRGLIEVALILKVESEEFDQLIRRLAAKDDDDLREAAASWPRVQQTIIREFPRLGMRA